MKFFDNTGRRGKCLRGGCRSKTVMVELDGFDKEFSQDQFFCKQHRYPMFSMAGTARFTEKRIHRVEEEDSWLFELKRIRE